MISNCELFPTAFVSQEFNQRKQESLTFQLGEMYSQGPIKLVLLYFWDVPAQNQEVRARNSI